MTLLNQIIAVEKGVKSKAEAAMTELHRVVQKPALLTGLTRQYKPKDEDGDALPPESTPVQIAVNQVLDTLARELDQLFDVTLTKEVANTEARADVVVDGTTLLTDVPVTYLLFLEKQLINIATFVAKLPTLDPASVWVLDANTGVYRSDPVTTTRTKKVPRNWVKAEATQQHPAQVEVYHEDVIVGYWTKVDFSGAIPLTRQMELADRVAALQRAVKFAREEANSHTIADMHGAGGAVFRYLFG
jgi:hypothetical protein